MIENISKCPHCGDHMLTVMFCCFIKSIYGWTDKKMDVNDYRHISVNLTITNVKN